MIDGEGIAKSDWSNVIRYEVEEPTTDPDHEPEPDLWWALPPHTGSHCSSMRWKSPPQILTMNLSRNRTHKYIATALPTRPEPKYGRPGWKFRPLTAPS